MTEAEKRKGEKVDGTVCDRAFLQPPANHSLLKRVRLRSAADRSEHPYHESLKHQPYLMK